MGRSVKDASSEVHGTSVNFVELIHTLEGFCHLIMRRRFIDLLALYAEAEHGLSNKQKGNLVYGLRGSWYAHCIFLLKKLAKIVNAIQPVADCFDPFGYEFS
jgi:hypothetical protein